jgi:hypothetical protein
MTPPSFEFCALSFLTQWQENECALHRAVSMSPSVSEIRQALNYFQVSRTFKDLDVPGNAAFILRCLMNVRDDRTLQSPHEKVDKLAMDLRKKFGRLNISAASKLLWLTYRDPFIIYDARAVNALRRHFHHRFSAYKEYSEAWREEYANARASIRDAVNSLPKARLFMRLPPPPDQKLLRMAKETWFMERVFDVFLWEVGVKVSPASRS